MSFSVDQFMQVKCKFQLTSESESSESIHLNNERVRLCTSVDLDRNSTLIVMICSNELGNNHIIAYYIERRFQSTRISTETNPVRFDGLQRSPNFRSPASNVAFSQLVSQKQDASPTRQSTSALITRTKPRIIVKQIYYHSYNEDIVAICLSETGNKLALVSASATIYVIPIKNILLNLHANQLRSSQGKSMYFYDASIIDCCSLEDPIAMVYWESIETENKSTIVVANGLGELNFISVEHKREIHRTNMNEKIRMLQIIRDRFSYSLLITCDDLRQFRFALELVQQSQQDYSSDIYHVPSSPNSAYTDEFTYLERDTMPSWDRRPIPIKLQGAAASGVGASTTGAIHRALATQGQSSSQASLFQSLGAKDRSIPMIFYQQSGMLCIVDVIGSPKTSAPNGRAQVGEPRLLRFFATKQFYYRPQKPQLVCKLSCLAVDETITHVVLTDRFLALTTDRNRCLINSKNCCNLRNSSSSIELDPLVKEIIFGSEEKILDLIKSPVSNDQDNIIDSFLLITDRSIYSIEARHSCRDMFITLIDSHLGIRPRHNTGSLSDYLRSSGLNRHECTVIHNNERKNSGSNLMISNFLNNRDELYERISYESRAFSILFKLELNSLYEAYGDRLLIRGHSDLANRFFHLAQFSHSRILGKYIRLGAYEQTIYYVKNILEDENEVLEEKERLDLAKTSFDCHLAKTIIERSKLNLFTSKMRRKRLKNILELYRSTNTQNDDIAPHEITRRDANSSAYWAEAYSLCDHSPAGQVAKLSANTIVVDGGEDEDATMIPGHRDRRNTRQDSKLECERALISFVNDLMPSSLFSYVMTQLIDFNLIDLADSLARSNNRISVLISVMLRARDENRIIFRGGKNEKLADKLVQSNHHDLVRISRTDPRFLEFITSTEVTKALVKDISLTTEYLGYQQTLVQFRGYSLACLHLLDSFKKLVSANLADGENSSKMFSEEQKKSIEHIFIEFLSTCLDESTEDSCRLWFNYINFYLNHVGLAEELEADILGLLRSDTSDCRIAITLYKALSRDEGRSSRPLLADGVANTPLESMDKLYNLSELFSNEFLMRLLQRTLELVPRSANLNALSDCLGVDGLSGQVALPVENVWRQILKTIQSAALSSTTAPSSNVNDHTSSYNLRR